MCQLLLRYDECILAYSCELSLKGGWKHVGEKLQCYGKKELHEWNQNERQEWD
jgi:hypothetical protein